MLRDFKSVGRNSKGNEEVENVPVESKHQLIGSKVDTDVCTRAPLNAIQDPANLEQDVPTATKVEKTPTKSKGKSSDLGLPHRTPDKYGSSLSSRNRFGWGQKGEISLAGESGFGNGGLPTMTPRSVRTFGRVNSGYSECNSTQSTPTKSVNKPPNPRIKIEAGNRSVRTNNFASLYKGISTALGVPSTIVNTVEVPHFDLKEDPSFWMDHNVQVLIRVRPLNSMEKSVHGCNRCLKQESAQTLTWVGQPETRFTFDHVACETINQETLFRMAGLPMVENCLSGYNSCMFAYGQTGSGKTHTMLGEIGDLEVKPSPNRGMTPRIFEFLFARIQAEEESRSDEKLKYNCKCSFLEIYNEQITDLLDPSSTNLLLREDMKKGVYVENLSECEVQTVSDILRLLSQGSSNRKVAATNMNRESSRSHSVFTCVIESQWEKDSTTNLRFARLNLVDLAGSERQKASGAEGERLKEAASINKSLSTLGHVIMVLLDVAHGKPKHVPYRDSRLTFLLQDSLGGNSKTMIIANVSPSICCAAETLNTLKFAQRAKLIQNNAVVNEDTSRDVTALQHQIELLKKELSALRRHNVSRTLSFGSSQDNVQMLEISSEEKVIQDPPSADDALEPGSKATVRMSSKQFKSLETTLAGALRREQMAEASIKQLEAEIEQLNRLVRQREEDTRSTKMMLRFREEKIRRMESLVSSSIPTDSYLQQENTALSEEIQLLQVKLERNPEITRFALENIRLLDQIRRFQDFYEEGEREMLLAEVSELRNQLLQYLDSNSMIPSHSAARTLNQESTNITRGAVSFQLELNHTVNELEECRANLSACLEENEKISREIQELRTFLNDRRLLDVEQDVLKTHSLKEVHEEETRTATLNRTEEIVNLHLELDILKVMLNEEKIARSEVENKAIGLQRYLESEKDRLLLLEKQYADAEDDAKSSKSIVEALESQQILLINEAEDLKTICKEYVELLASKELEILALREQFSSHRSLAQPSLYYMESEDSPLQTKLTKMQGSLEKAKRMNTWYQSDRAFKTSNEEEMDAVRRQVEAETAEVIVCMQEELAILQRQVDESTSKETETMSQMKILKTELKDNQEKLYIVTQDCEVLQEKLRYKEGELNMLNEEWEKLICEIEELLSAGHEAIVEATNQINHISSSFPQKRTWISGQVGNILRNISEKELVVEELTQSLVDANNKRSDLECMLRSLRGATLVITEAHQSELSEKEKEIFLLTSQLNTNTSTIEKLNNRIKLGEDHVRKSALCATVAFVIIGRLSEMCHNHLNAATEQDILLTESKELNMRSSAILNNQAVAIEESEKKIGYLLEELEDSKKSCDHLQLMLSDERNHASAVEQKLKDVEIDYILKTTEKLAELKAGVSSVKSCMAMQSAPPAKSDDESGQEAMLSVEKYIEQTDSNHASNEIDRHLARGLIVDICSSSVETHQSVAVHSPENVTRTTFQKVFDRENTIILLRKEIESALTSLKDVQDEMEKLRGENKEILLSREQSYESMKLFKSQTLSLQETMVTFKKQSEVKLVGLDRKLQNAQKSVEDTLTDWCQMKELDDLENDEARMVAAEKSAEASYAIAKFEEVQETMKEADIMINGLMIENEAMKYDMGRLKQEKCALVNEVRNLQSRNAIKDRECENLEKQLKTDFIDSRNMILELESVLEEVQSSLGESFKSLTLDFVSLKSQFLSSTRIFQTWLEDIWSEIILKDCALSVLHLCHMGILLEAVTGLNAENGLLQHNLCESESLISNLRDHNFKTRRDLEMCRNLESKLLADIKTSFDRFSMKEKETAVLNVKISNFENRISDLQHQEELMLQRSNNIGSELAILWKELDSSNSTILETLTNQEKLLQDKEGYLRSQADCFMLDLSSKEIELLVLASRLEETSCHEADLEGEKICCWDLLDELKKEVILLEVDGHLKEQIMKVSESEVSLLQKESEDSIRERKDLLWDLEQSHLRISERDQVIRVVQLDSHLLKEISRENDTLKEEIIEIRESKVGLLTKIQALEVNYETVLENLNQKETEVEVSDSHFADFHIKTQKLEDEVRLITASLRELQSESEVKSEVIVKLTEQNEYLKTEIRRVESEHCAAFQDLDAKKSVYDSTLSRLNILDMENHKLQDSILSMESTIALLQSDINRKDSELQILVNKESKSSEDNAFLKSILIDHEKSTADVLKILRLNSVQWIDKLENVEKMSTMSLNQSTTTFLNKLFEEVCDNSEMASKFVEELECLQCLAEDLSSENIYLQDELLRKGEIEKGLLFDLSFLQESASNTKDQKDELQELNTSLEDLKDQLAAKTSDLNEAVAHGQELEDQLKEKMQTISTFELRNGKEQESLKLLSTENTEHKTRVEDLLAMKCSIEEELVQRLQVSEGLELELQEMDNAFSQMNNSVDSLKSNLNEAVNERDNLHSEVLTLKEKLSMAKAQAEEYEAILAESQEIAESRKVYSEEKEEEVKLLERSVEELEYTINVLENKVEIVKEEAERQRLLREELELELQTIKRQMQNVESRDAEMKRCLDQKGKKLQEALKQIQILERDVGDRNSEVAQFREHVVELNMQAEAQASEYKQRFKALEAMVEQVRLEGSSSGVTSTSANKLEKNASKSRGSGSPFKCIGIGLAQQIKSERDEELTAQRARIEELEALAASRQKEIFLLNARLASAESMTHDVIRDLLGVKLDMTHYATLMDSQQVPEIMEKARLLNVESHEKNQEAIKLKQQLSEFIEERKGWLEEMDRKQAELVASQISLEKLHQRDQLLKAENDMLKLENSNRKRKVIELEGEVNKLSGQQNLQQRIHHHAKVKEENNQLRTQNETLSTKLKRAETILARMKEELASHRASSGMKPYINFDEEQRLQNKLTQTEEEKLQLTQKLLNLCTSILKAAGITRSISDVNLSAAEEALQHLKNHISSLERELDASKFKDRINSEKARLSMLMPQISSVETKSEDRSATPKRSSNVTFLSTLDR